MDQENPTGPLTDHGRNQTADTRFLQLRLSPVWQCSPKEGSAGGESWTAGEMPPVRTSTGAMDEGASKQEVGSAWRMGDQRDTNRGSSAKQGQVIFYKTLNGCVEVRELTTFSVQCMCHWKCRRL